MKWFKKLKIELPYDLAIPLLNIDPKKFEIEELKDIWSSVFIAALFFINFLIEG